MKKIYLSLVPAQTQSLNLLLSKLNRLVLNPFRLSLSILAVLAITATTAQAQAVTSFTLVNAQTDTDIRTLANGETIDLSALQNGQLSIRANTDPATVGSVRFNTSFKIRDVQQLEGETIEARMNRERRRDENTFPYALFGATATAPYDYTGGELAGGEITVTATPFTATNAGGTAGTPLTITLNVTPFSVTSFTLVDADTDQDIRNLTEGEVINLFTLRAENHNNLSIRANTTPSRLGSVVMVATFPVREAEATPENPNTNANGRVENHFPYALFGAPAGTTDYASRNIPVGRHAVTATPYARTFGPFNTTGNTAGGAATINFTVIDTQLSSGGDIFNDRLGFSFSAYPNPAPAKANIRFKVAKTDQVVVEVYDLKGAMVSRLFEQEARAGSEYNLTLDTDKLHSGVYVCRLKSGQYSVAHRIMVAK